MAFRVFTLMNMHILVKVICLIKTTDLRLHGVVQGLPITMILCYSMLIHFQPELNGGVLLIKLQILLIILVLQHLAVMVV